jgi:hypothetical protein
MAQVIWISYEGYKGVEKQASDRQPRRMAIWKAQHIGGYVSIYKSPCNAGAGPEAPLINSFYSLGVMLPM